MILINNYCFRYADPSDPSLVLIYDEAGFIAGSQSGMTRVGLFV